MEHSQPLLLMVSMGSSLGVALSSFPGRTTLTRTLDVHASHADRYRVASERRSERRRTLVHPHVQPMRV